MKQKIKRRKTEYNIYTRIERSLAKNREKGRRERNLENNACWVSSTESFLSNSKQQKAKLRRRNTVFVGKRGKMCPPRGTRKGRRIGREAERRRKRLRHCTHSNTLVFLSFDDFLNSISKIIYGSQFAGILYV